MKVLRKVVLVILISWIIFAQSCMFFRTSDKSAAAKFETAGVKASIVYQKVGDNSIHYVKSGTDNYPTLIFIHGSPGSWDAFESYLKDSALLQQFRMVSIDRPGFGYSNFGHALNLDEQSALLSNIIKSVDNGKPVFLVGHSLGGPLCIRLAIDNPGTFTGMVLLSAAIDPALEKPEKWRLLFMNTPLQYLVPGAMRPSNYELWYLKTDLVKLTQDISTASLPFCWMVHGDHDMMVSYKNVDFALANLDSSKLSVITIKGANHFIPWSHYQTIKELLMKLPLL